MSMLAGGVSAAHGHRWVDWLEARGWAIGSLYALLAIIALVPLLAVTVPPLVDYPNHLARMYILSHWADDAALRQNYVIDWKLHPNMAMELLVPTLARFMSIYTAGKVFIGLTLLALLGGTLALRKALVGRVGVWPVFAALFLYNYVLAWGFLDYLFTAGLALFAFAAWIALRTRGALIRVPLFTAVAMGLFIAHVFGLFAFGLLVLGYEAWFSWRHCLTGRRFLAAWATTGLPFVPAALFFVHWTMANHSDVAAISEFGPWTQRFLTLISPVYVGLPWIDFPTAAFVALVFMMCRSSKALGFVSELKLPVLLLAAATVAMPHYLSGVWGTHFRLPVVIACIVVAGVRVAPGTGRVMALVLPAAMALFVLRTGYIAASWSDFDRKFTEFRSASAVIERGKSLLAIEDETDLPAGRLPFYGMQFWNLAGLAVIERSVFMPTLFTGHISVDAAPARQAINTSVGTPVSPDFLKADADPATSHFPLGYRFSRYIRIYWTDWPRHFDYALSIRFANEYNPDPRYLKAIDRRSFFDIYRVSPTPLAPHEEPG